MKQKILIVDDEKGLRYTFQCFLSEAGYDVTPACDYNEALKIISEHVFDMIFADIVLGGKTGIDLLKIIKEKNMNCPVIMLTGYPNINTAVEAIRAGAFDYLTKPVKEEQIIQSARVALEYKRVLEEKEKYRKNLQAIFTSVKDGIISVDKDLNILELNEAAKIIFNLPDASKNNSLKKSLNYSNSGDFLEAVEKTIKTKEPVELYRIECHSGHKPFQIVNLNVTPLINITDETGGAVIVIKDETELVETERKLQERGQYHNIIGKSKKMEELYSLLEKLAPVPSTVIITGESGTGKELVADALHYKGNRKNNPLMKVNCAALPETLLESELFGHVKGSFTGAVKDKKGWFEKAHKGTIFLDEINDITPAMQLRLLRVIQEKEIVPVGSTGTIKVDVRVIVSTNQDIEKKVREGNFREDLYYRLKVMEVKLPPLRERREDINLLVEYFIKKFNREFNKNITGISQNVQKIFMTYDWPGNIRELEHTIEHAFVLIEQSVITVEVLPDEFKNLPLTQKQNSKTDDKAIAIIEALEKTGWKKAKAARLLNMDRKTIYRKMKEYNIPIKK